MTSMFAAPLSAGKPRDPRGRFASPATPHAIQTVLLPNWQFAYRVGPGGRIYARIEDARRFARFRAARGGIL